MRQHGALPRDGEQYCLRLFEGVPWEGRSPRGLTRGRFALFSSQSAPPHEVFFDREQLEFWPVDGNKEIHTVPLSRGAVPLGMSSRRVRRVRLKDHLDEEGPHG